MQAQKNNSSSEYWDFIEKYYPNYFSCNDVLLCDILNRKLEEEEIDELDEQHIKGWDIKKEKIALEKRLFGMAMQNYFNQFYPK